MYNYRIKWFFIFLSVLLVFIWAGCKSSPVSEEVQNANQEEIGKDGDEEEASPDEKGKFSSGNIIQVGQAQEKDGITVQLDEIILSVDPGLFDPPPPGHVFIYPTFTITNMHETEYPLYFMSDTSCVAHVDGEEYKRSMESLLSYQGDIEQLDIDVDYGSTRRAMTGFIIPENWKELKLVINQGFTPYVDPINLTFEVENK